MGGHGNKSESDGAAPARFGVLGSVKERQALEVDKLFRQLIKYNGSDLHLKVGKPPTLRVRGELRELQTDPITKEGMEQLLYPMMNDRNRGIFHAEGGADFAYLVEYEGDTWRFRVNLFIQTGKMGMVSVVKSNGRSPTSRGCSSRRSW
jgi:twitching motility protein PilT